MGLDARNRFEFVYETVADLVQFPDFFEAVPQERRFPLEFFPERTFVSEGGKEMVEYLVVSYDALVRRASFETRDFVAEFFGIFGLEAYAFFRSEKHEKRPEENGYRDDEKNGEFGHAPRIPPPA